MVLIKNKSDLTKLTNGNCILGTFPAMENSECCFYGKNNILFCEPGVKLIDSRLSFAGDNSVVYLGKNRHVYRLGVALNNNNVFHMGINNYVNQKMTVILSEERHCFIGDDGIFSLGITIRNADPHLIYDCETRKRINPTKSIYIGDHVWIGLDCLILKGAQIDSGSIIGAKSVITKNAVSHNSVWAGDPLRKVREGVFWDIACVHKWTEEMSQTSEFYDEFLEKNNKTNPADSYIFNYSEDEYLSFDEIETNINQLKDSKSRCDYLIELNKNKSKNRFVRAE